MSSVWTRPITVESINRLHENTAVARLGIEFLTVGDNFLIARVPVDDRTRQPRGILHGGVSVVLAETLGSTGAASACPPGHAVVGLDINANHIRSVSEGWVTGRAEPMHLGRSTHVWQIECRDEQDRLTCVSRITMAVLAPKN